MEGQSPQTRHQRTHQRLAETQKEADLAKVSITNPLEREALSHLGKPNLLQREYRGSQHRRAHRHPLLSARSTIG